MRAIGTGISLPNLYIEFKDAIVNIKKSALDDFVKDFKKWRRDSVKRASPAAVSFLTNKVKKTLSLMSSVFGVCDSLLRQVGMITVYYYLFRQIVNKKVTKVDRGMLVRFEKDRERNREVVEETGESGSVVRRYSNSISIPKRQTTRMRFEFD